MPYSTTTAPAPASVEKQDYTRTAAAADARQKRTQATDYGAKTQAQLDEELRHRMDDMAGDGGAAGVEYEDGQPVAMKRSVKNNMFRYI